MANPVDVGFNRRIFRSMLTRPADTTTYTINDSYSGDPNLNFVWGTAWKESALNVDDACGRRNSQTKSGEIIRLELAHSVNQALKLAAEIFFFSEVPVAVADNAANAIADAKLNTGYIGKATVLASDWVEVNEGSGAAGNCVATVKLDLPYELPEFDDDNLGLIYGMAKVKNAYAPLSAETLMGALVLHRD